MALIGDGYSDLAKHLHLAFNLLMVAWVVLLVHVVILLAASRRSVGMACAGLVVFVVLASVPIAIAAYQPVAIGTLDPPPSTIKAGGTQRLTGWAKDPFGIQTIQAHVGQAVYSATSVSGAEDVDRMFPLSRKQPAHRFEVEIQAPKSKGWFRVAIRARNGAQVHTEVDSIWLEAL